MIFFKIGIPFHHGSLIPILMAWLSHWRRHPEACKASAFTTLAVAALGQVWDASCWNDCGTVVLLRLFFCWQFLWGVKMWVHTYIYTQSYVFIQIYTYILIYIHKYIYIIPQKWWLNLDKCEFHQRVSSTIFHIGLRKLARTGQPHQDKSRGKHPRMASTQLFGIDLWSIIYFPPTQIREWVLAPRLFPTRTMGWIHFWSFVANNLPNKHLRMSVGTFFSTRTRTFGVKNIGSWFYKIMSVEWAPPFIKANHDELWVQFHRSLVSIYFGR